MGYYVKTRYMLAVFLNPKPINGLPIKSVDWPIHRLIVSPRVTDQLPVNDILNILKSTQKNNDQVNTHD
jgi:hypothetical protein